MTDTKIPQDIIDDARAAGFLITDNGTIFRSAESSTAKLLVKFAALRDQRQAVPDWCLTVVQKMLSDIWATEYPHSNYEPADNLPDAIRQLSNTLHNLGNYDWAIDARLTTEQTLRDLGVESAPTPPQANALVAAGMVKAAEICLAETRGTSEDWAQSASHCRQRILAAIPADSQAALREVCMEVASRVFNQVSHFYNGKAEEVSTAAIVDSIIGASDKVEGGE